MTSPRPARSSDQHLTVSKMSGMGIELVGAIGTMAVFGWLLDKWLGTEPWLIVAGLLVGSSRACIGSSERHSWRRVRLVLRRKNQSLRMGDPASRLGGWAACKSVVSGLAEGAFGGYPLLPRSGCGEAKT